MTIIIIVKAHQSPLRLQGRHVRDSEAPSQLDWLRLLISEEKTKKLQQSTGHALLARPKGMMAISSCGSLAIEMSGFWPHIKKMLGCFAASILTPKAYVNGWEA